MTDSKLHMAGILATIVVHVGVGLAINAAGGDDDDSATPNLAERQVIEAALAFKKTTPRKNRQPQKKRNPKVAPKETVGVSRDADKEPAPTKEKDRKPPPKEAIDPSATLEKYRNIDTDEEFNDIEEDVEDQGADDGSEWGTAEDALGNPYVGELRGRIEQAWAKPTLDTGGGEVLGCVRLSKDGALVERELAERSKNSTLNRSVEEALRKASNMTAPVPKSVEDLLTKKGICFRFSPGDK